MSINPNVTFKVGEKVVFGIGTGQGISTEPGSELWRLYDGQFLVVKVEPISEHDAGYMGIRRQFVTLKMPEGETRFSADWLEHA